MIKKLKIHQISIIKSSKQNIILKFFRLLFNCADVIAAGSIEDGVQLVSDLHKDLQEDISIKYVGRGHPVLAESHKKAEGTLEVEKNGKKKKPNLGESSTSQKRPPIDKASKVAKQT